MRSSVFTLALIAASCAASATHEPVPPVEGMQTITADLGAFDTAFEAAGDRRRVLAILSPT